MSREIKFRGQRVDKGEWVYGNLLKLETDFFTDSNDTGFMWYIIPYRTNGCIRKTDLMLKFISPCHEVIPETVGQYTGLKDNNSKEIYEGDLIITRQEDEEDVFKVEWDEDSARFILSTQTFTCDFDSYNGTDCEVIGNCYDNPELLQEVDK